MNSNATKQYSPTTGVGTRVEYGLKLNCAKQGCDPVHSDNGYITTYFEGYGEPDPKKNYMVSGHATTLVCREVVLVEWSPLQ